MFLCILLRLDNILKYKSLRHVEALGGFCEVKGQRRLKRAHNSSCEEITVHFFRNSILPPTDTTTL